MRVCGSGTVILESGQAVKGMALTNENEEGVILANEEGHALDR